MIVTLITFGSYRLGAYRPDADVDLIALCPPSCTRDDFFTSLVTLMENEPSICDIHPIASAYTPVLKFTINSINFDMLFGRVYGETNIDKLVQYQKQQQQQRMRIMSPPSPLDANAVANDNTNYNADVIDNAIDNDDASMSNSIESRGELIKESTAHNSTNDDDYSNINNEHEHEFPIEDSFLMGMDDSEVRSANGVRVTQYIMNCVPNPDRFRLVLCAVKEWASAHGIYSNVLGFLGGVNWAIMVAHVCKRYPIYGPSSLLRTFFQTYATWRWPNPVQLVVPSSAETTMSNAPSMIGGGMKPWDPQTNPRDARHVMPIITPVFPRSKSKQTNKQTNNQHGKMF
ncbi:MAG: poly(A) polymerase Pap1 [Bacillariaceae sp.]